MEALTFLTIICALNAGCTLGLLLIAFLKRNEETIKCPATYFGPTPPNLDISRPQRIERRKPVVVDDHRAYQLEREEIKKRPPTL